MKKHKKKKKISIGLIAVYTFAIIYLFLTLYPFLWMIFSSFKTNVEIVSGNMTILPQTWTLDNYRNIFSSESGNIGRWAFNSAFVAVTVTALNLFLNTLAGYSLARCRYKGRNQALFIILAAMIIPAQVLLIPNYLIISSFGWINTYTALIIPGAINATYIFFMRQFFINFSTEVEEAAQIDGLNHWQSFFYIVFPMARPALVTQAIFIFLGSWNSYLSPLLYMKTPEMYTLPVGMQTFMSSTWTDWGAVMTTATISLIPVLILYGVFHKQFFYGLQAKGDK